MRFTTLILSLLLATTLLVAQGDRNPFELVDRLPPEEQLAAVTPEESGPLNPFDLRAPATQSPAAPPLSGVDFGDPIVVEPTDPNDGRGIVIAIHLFFLLGLASLWVLFRGLLKQCMAGTINDGVITQIYTRRSGGQLGALWVCYLFFFLAAGFFLYQLALRNDVSLRLGVIGSWLTYSLMVAAAVGLKHGVLQAFGRTFRLRKEMSKYSFVLMVFSILAGLLLVPVNLLVSYAPEGWQIAFLYLGVIGLVGIYLLHLLRGLFIANRLVGEWPLHFLLYICAIEIAPLLLIYRYLSNSLI